MKSQCPSCRSTDLLLRVACYFDLARYEEISGSEGPEEITEAFEGLAEDSQHLLECRDCNFTWKRPAAGVPG